MHYLIVAQIILCINETLKEDLAILTPTHTSMRLATASDSVCLEITSRTTRDFFHEDIRLSDNFFVVPELSEEVIIGVNTMQKWRMKLDFKHNTVIVDPGVA